MELDNTEVTYWGILYPRLTEVLAEMSGQTLVQVHQDLALIDGDYMNMTDDDVLATFVNERIRWPLLERNTL